MDFEVYAKNLSREYLSEEFVLRSEEMLEYFVQKSKQECETVSLEVLLKKWEKNYSKNSRI